MIVRIHMEDQYRLSDDAVAEVDKLDDRLLRAINDNDQGAFSATLSELLGYVRKNGVKVPVEEIVSSDLIFPSEDVTLDEARAIMEKAAASGQATGQASAEA
jgi:CBS domain-containing protein